MWFGRLSRWSSLSVADTDPENHGVWGGQESAAQPTNGRPCQAGRRPRVGGRWWCWWWWWWQRGRGDNHSHPFSFFLKLQHSGHSRGGPPDFTLVSSRHRNRNKPGKQKKQAPAKNSGVCFSFKENLQVKVTVFFFILHLFYGVFLLLGFLFFRATGQRLHPQRLLAKIKHTPALCLKSNQAPLSAPFSSRSWWRLLGGGG